MRDLDLPNGTLELIKVALVNDRKHALIRNFALIACYSYSDKLLDICKNPIDQETRLLSLLNIKEKPENFLVFTASCLKRVQDKIYEMLKEKKESRIPLVTDYDGYVLSGMGLAFSEIIWNVKESDDFKGPSLQICLNKLGNVSRNMLYATITKHYLGNILQHYFEKAGIRREIEDLPEDEEIVLREEDSSEIADHCLERVKLHYKEKYNPFEFVDELDNLIRNLA